MFNAYKNLTLALLRLVNAPRGRSYDQYRNRALLKGDQKQELVDAGHLITQKQLAHPITGEISMRLGTGQLVINTKDSNLSDLADKSLVVCPPAPDKPVELAAKHLNWHRIIYKLTAAQGVLLCHPPYTITLANAGQMPRQDIAIEISEAVAGVAIVQQNQITEVYLPEIVDTHHALMIPGIGALVWGVSPLDAVNRAEALEYLCHLTAIGHQTGLTPKF